MEEKEYSNVFAIPANYTDSGRILGGMLEVRNTVEAILLIGVIGYPEIMWLPVPATIKVVIMTITILPLGVVALMGVSGDSFIQFFGHIIRFWLHRRKLHFRRVGYQYETSEIKERVKNRRMAQK